LKERVRLLDELARREVGRREMARENWSGDGEERDLSVKEG
jgi:hypothetical protein